MVDILRPPQRHDANEMPGEADAIEAERGHPASSGQGSRLDAAAPDDGHRRSAHAPSEIATPGWKEIALRVYRGISDDRILMNAASVAFYALLAVFPGIAALVSIYGLFADPASIARQLDTFSGVLPGGAIEVIRDQLTMLTQNGRATLGVSFAVSLVVSLWSANGGIKALLDALNTLYEEKEERSFIRLNALSLAFTLASIALMVVAIVCIVALPVFLNYLPGFFGTVLNIARWPLVAVLVAIALACIYRYGPNRTEPELRWISPGSAFAALAWLAGSAVFSYYAANFGNFDKTYGSLGAVIGFMMWLWLSVIVILIGGKLNAEIEREATGSTDGAAKD